MVEGKSLVEEGEEGEGRRGMKTTYYHINSKGVVIVYAEISFSTDTRVLFPNTKKTIFFFLLENYHHS